MDSTLFADLKQSLKEAKAIRKGTAAPSRKFVAKIGSNTVAPQPDQQQRYSKLWPQLQKSPSKH